MLQAEVFSIDRLPTYPWIPRIAVVCVTLMHLQVKAGTAPLQAPAPDRQQQGRPSQASPQTAPVINPVGASSNYTNKGLVSVKTPSSASCGQSVAVAAPSSSRAGSHAHVVTGERVDQAQHGEATTAADTPPAETNTSQLDKPAGLVPRRMHCRATRYAASCSSLLILPFLVSHASQKQSTN